jgi:hypothetical protein
MAGLNFHVKYCKMYNVRKFWAIENMSCHHFKPNFEAMEATRASLQEKSTQFFKDVNKLVYWRDICLNVQGD